jgi:hypothetical protein
MSPGKSQNYIIIQIYVEFFKDQDGRRKWLLYFPDHMQSVLFCTNVNIIVLICVII